MRRFTVTLSDDEVEALKKIANQELRDFREQARILIRSSLENMGILPPRVVIRPKLGVKNESN